MAAELEEDEPWVASQTLKIPKVMAEKTLLFLGITTLISSRKTKVAMGFHPWGAMEMHTKI